jgi:hypothetical protein
MLERNIVDTIQDPALNTLWVLEIPFTNDADIVVYAERMQATFPKTPFRARYNEGSNSYFPETSDIDGINITFYEASDLRVTTWLDVWRKLIRSSDGNYGLPVTYKKEILAKLYSQDNMSTPVKTLKYIGCAPTDQTPFELQYDDATGRITVEVQFSVDSLEQE